jgi:hypothetical protein
MCKLCNTDRKPCPPNFRNNLQVVKFKNIVYEYTGEYPCELCYKCYVSHANSYGAVADTNGTIDMDRHIINKLRVFISWQNLTVSQKDKWRNITRKYSERRKVPTETVDHCIRKICNNFKVTMRRNNINYIKTFKTLEEAITYRDSLIASLNNTRN